jgi:hypothetical protein
MGRQPDSKRQAGVKHLQCHRALCDTSLDLTVSGKPTAKMIPPTREAPAWYRVGHFGTCARAAFLGTFILAKAP